MINDELLKSIVQPTNSCMYSLLHMMRAYSMFAHGEVKKHTDVNMQRMGMLMLLRTEGNGMSQTQLAEELCVKPSSIASMLNNMEKEGLIKRESDKEDRRIKRIYLIEKGKKISDDAFKYMMGTAYDFFFNFTDEEKQQFIALMKKMEENMTHIMDEEK